MKIKLHKWMLDEAHWVQDTTCIRITKQVLNERWEHDTEKCACVCVQACWLRKKLSIPRCTCTTTMFTRFVLHFFQVQIHVTTMGQTKTQMKQSRGRTSPSTTALNYNHDSGSLKKQQCPSTLTKKNNKTTTENHCMWEEEQLPNDAHISTHSICLWQLWQNGYMK